MTTVKNVSLSELPTDIFYGYAYMTGSIITPSDDGEDATDDGFIDPAWSMNITHPSRNDVRPAATWNKLQDIDSGETSRESFGRWIRETVENWFGDAFEDNHDGTVYGTDEVRSTDGACATYALHFVASHHAMRTPTTEYRVTL